MSDWDKVPVAGETGKAAPSGWESVPVTKQAESEPEPELEWQDTPYGFKVRSIQISGKQTVERPDNAVYMTADVDPRFKGQEGWKYLDPKTGVYIPAPSSDTSQFGWFRRNFGPETAATLGRNIKAGLQRPLEAVEGLVHDVANVTGIESDPTYLANIQRLEEQERYRQAMANQAGGALASGQILGEAAPALAYGALLKQPPPSVGWVGRAALTGAQAAPYAYAATPGTQRERTTAALTAGITGTATQAALDNPATRAVARWAAEKAAAVRQRLMPPIPKNTPKTTPEIPTPVSTDIGQDGRIWAEPTPAIPGMKPEWSEVEQLGKKYGINLRPGDITGDPQMQSTENRLMRNTLEMQKIVRDQAKDVEGATGRLLEAANQDLKQYSFDNMDDIIKASMGNDKRSKAAKRVLDAIDYAGSDWKLILQTSGKTKLLSGQLKADAAYEKLRQAASGYGEIAPIDTIKSLEQARSELNQEILPDQGTVSIIDRMFKRIMRQEAATAETTGQPVVGGMPVPANLPANNVSDLSFEGMRKFRSELSEHINGYYTGKSQVVGSNGVKYLEEIKKSIENDMESFAKTNGPELKNLWKNADRTWKEEVAPFKNAALANAIADESPKKMVNFFISNKDPYVQRKVFSKLDPKGKAALRLGILDEAFEYGGMPQHGTEAIALSPAKIASWLEKHDDVIKLVFDNEEKWGIQGFGKIMRHIDRVSTLGANPTNGAVVEQLLYKVLHRKSWLTHPIERVTEKLADLERANELKLFTTPEGKYYLLQASDAKPGSAKMQQIIDRMAVKLPRLLGISAGRATIPPKRATIQETE